MFLKLKFEKRMSLERIIRAVGKDRRDLNSFLYFLEVLCYYWVSEHFSIGKDLKGIWLISLKTDYTISLCFCYFFYAFDNMSNIEEQQSILCYVWVSNEASTNTQKPDCNFIIKKFSSTTYYLYWFKILGFLKPRILIKFEL